MMRPPPTEPRFRRRLSLHNDSTSLTPGSSDSSSVATSAQRNPQTTSSARRSTSRVLHSEPVVLGHKLTSEWAEQSVHSPQPTHRRPFEPQPKHGLSAVFDVLNIGRLKEGRVPARCLPINRDRHWRFIEAPGEPAIMWMKDGGRRSWRAALISRCLT